MSKYRWHHLLVVGFTNLQVKKTVLFFQIIITKIMVTIENQFAEGKMQLKNMFIDGSVASA